MAAGTLTPAKAESKTMSTDQPSQALERPADKTPAVIMTPEQYRGALLRWQALQLHVLTPFANISGLAPQHGIITSVIQINTEKISGEVYDGLPFLKQDQLGIAKNGLRKIAEGLGISTRLKYISVGTIRHYWHVKAIASYRGLDGSVINREGGQEWDLRDGSDRLKGWTANQITEARKHGLRACETRAINAAIRECGCGIKQAYLKSELAHAFVATRVAFQPDMTDPDQKRIVLERALGGTNTLYPGSDRALPGEIVDTATGEVVDAQTVGRSSTPAASSAAPAPAAPDPDQPPVPDAVRIVDVKSRSGETKGKAWTRYAIVDSAGVEHSTFDKKLAAFAEKAQLAKQWVEVTSQTDGQYTNLVEIAPAGSQPILPEMGDL